MITNERLESFKNLYKNYFDIELDDQSALEKAISLVRMMELVYVPMTESEYKKYVLGIEPEMMGDK